MHGESAVRLTADDAAVTERYWETVTRWQTSEPERDLMLAVLRVAIRDFKKRYHARDGHFRDARDWLFEKGSDELFAFESVCAVLRLSPRRIRNGLIQWIKQTNGRKMNIG